MTSLQLHSSIWDEVSVGWTDASFPKRRRKKSAFIRTDEELQGWMEKISLSPEQLAVLKMEEDQLLINGSAGSGKSVLLVYRMLKAMEEEPSGQRFLYVSFNKTLMQDAWKRLKRSSKFRQLQNKHQKVDVNTFHYTVAAILQSIGEKVEYFDATVPAMHKMTERIKTGAIVFMENFIGSSENSALPTEERLRDRHGGTFFLEEILWMKANGFISEQQYINCKRVGRGNVPQVSRAQRKTIFRCYEAYHELRESKYHGILDSEDYALLLLDKIGKIPDSLKYDHIYVDEVQDLQPMQIRALVKLCKGTMTLSGDPKQRIYKRIPLSYRELGLEIEGRRNRKLKINFRSTRQIMNLASSIQFTDTENDREDERIFVREGRKPQIRRCSSSRKLCEFLIEEIHRLKQEDPECSVAVIHRYDNSMDALFRSPYKRELEGKFHLITTEQYGRRYDYSQSVKPIFFTDPFSVKGLEFDHVFILHFDREHYPSWNKIRELKSLTFNGKTEGYKKDKAMIIDEEKKILYVAMTRARHRVYLLYASDEESQISSFAKDFDTKDYEAIGFRKTLI